MTPDMLMPQGFSRVEDSSASGATGSDTAG